MEVTFSIDPPNRELVIESDLDSKIDQLREQMPNDESVMGGINILDVANDMATHIGDDLESLVPQLCFGSIAALSSGQEVTLDLYAFDENVTLKSSGDSIEVSGTRIHTGTFPRRELLEQLVACGERFIAFLSRVRVDAESQSQLQGLIKLAGQARLHLQ